MNLLDRLLEHDAWTTEQLLNICARLTDDDLDHEFDVGHRTIRRTLGHIIDNMETWASLMDEQPVKPVTDNSISGMTRRLAAAKAHLACVAWRVADANAWDDLWLDQLDDPPKKKRFGTAIAHVITHSMHHRAQLLYMLRLAGVSDLPEGDVFSWENQYRA